MSIILKTQLNSLKSSMSFYHDLQIIYEKILLLPRPNYVLMWVITLLN